MIESLKLGGADPKDSPKIRRLNRLPIIVAIGLVVVFLAVIFYGLSSRGLRFGDDNNGGAAGRPASNDADRLKQGVPDGIIGEPETTPFQPTPAQTPEPARNPFAPHPGQATTTEPASGPQLEPEAVWRARLEREQQEQLLRELHRQRMASLQADDAANNSPIAVNLKSLQDSASTSTVNPPDSNLASSNRPQSAIDLYAEALQSGAGGQSTDQNGQAAKQQFFNQDIRDLGYLPNPVVAPLSPFELKRGSVIPATLVTGINSDLPGRITAQVSQNVYNSATGRNLLIPQGSKLFGRYDASISFGQDRVLVIWTDIIFPDGATLQIGGMAGTDVAGYGGFTDKVDNHYFETFGSAILVALIGAGTEMMLPQDRNSASGSNSAEDAARRSFAESFGQISEQTVSKNLDVQPTLEIRPGYQFNVLVDQDIVFPKAYR
ncbi:Pertussis toxin liberation protein G (plasmid) [Aminobacter sp. MSH1]|uniref:IncP-type conjugal transfer protein TrbI n=1 Tax=Aminobacter sp. MSH1 TaxID=374606 RepID=UPI0009DC5817|nr:IncP-type conjugal transfer protein TrbI [Aminobacter sp. MSH1]ARD70045.1 Pertussis toxin liberation protein G [Aminobacter sp. MSH1]